MNAKQMQMLQELIKELKVTHHHNVTKYLSNAACNAGGAEAEAAMIAATIATCVNETLEHVIKKLSDIDASAE